MTWFEAFRNQHGFTSYPDNTTPVTLDIRMVAVTYVCVLVSIATLVATLGIRGRQRWSSAIRACYAVAIASIILACIFSHGWQTGEVKIHCPYVYRSNHPFEGYVGIRAALNGANVTLSGYYSGASGSGYVYYAESMPWADFGQEPESYSYYLKRGLPEPILKVMEFLTVDGGGLRWGRSLHTAGHYACVLLWTSFSFWLITNVLLFSVVVYGAYMFFLTGLTMVLACVAYHACQNPQPLVIAFSDSDLRVSYGWSFWLTLVSGICTLVLGLILIVLDHFAHDVVSEFFHLEKLDDDDMIDYDISCRPSNVSFVMDRRGTVVPPMDLRRGSIFLEPGRRPSWYSDNILKSFSVNPLAGQVNKSFEGDAGTSKTNPMYSGEDRLSVPSFDSRDDDVRIDMEKACRDSEVCNSTKKPSLATLKEHRDNHANEKKWSSGTESPAKLTRQRSFDESIHKYTSRDSFAQRSTESSAEKCSNKSWHSNEISASSAHRVLTSSVSSGFMSPCDEGNDSQGTYIRLESFSRQTSSDSSTSTGETSVDSGRGLSGERNVTSFVESRGSDSKRSSVSTGSEIVINVVCDS